jgi:hypothetical protein
MISQVRCLCLAGNQFGGGTLGAAGQKHYPCCQAYKDGQDRQSYPPKQDPARRLRIPTQGCNVFAEVVAKVD